MRVGNDLEVVDSEVRRYKFKLSIRIVERSEQLEVGSEGTALNVLNCVFLFGEED